MRTDVMKTRGPFLFTLILLGAILGSRLVNLRLQDDLKVAKDLFRQEGAQQTQTDLTTYRNAFQQMYEGLRTIGRLPGVKRIDRFAAEFHDTDKQAVQEIYNNLASSVAMSEVYIVPANLEPDQIDPATGKLQTPITTFDQLIVGKTVEKRQDSRAEDVPEIEIYEYRQMKMQLAWFKQNYPTEQSVRGLTYPAVCSPEVITCDNSHYSVKRPDDRDRSGLVYSVPFYGQDHQLKGCISGVILTHSIQALSRFNEVGLANLSAHYLAASALFPTANLDWIWKQTPNPGAIYAEVLPVPVADGWGHWVVYATMPNAQFWSRPGCLAAFKSATISHIGVWLFAALLATFTGFSQRTHRWLELKIQERTSDLELQTARANELAVEAQAASQLKSEFLANMSHEIRTPMNGVIGMAELLQATELDEQQYHFTETMIRSGESLMTIINDILDVSKIEAGKLHLESVPFDLAELLEDLGDLYAKPASEKQIEFAIRLDPGVGRFRLGDSVRVRQIFGNLISNAIKFTFSGSVQLDVTAGPNGNGLVGRVTDTGPGIPADRHAAVFQSFTQADGSTTRQFGGTGLGLTICCQLAKLMGGDITLTSEVGKGSVFTATLPLELAEAPESLAEPELFQGQVVLVVDDWETNRIVVREHLERAECTVLEAESGPQALEILRANPLVGFVVLDYQMPGMDGLETLREIQKTTHPARILLLTSLDVNPELLPDGVVHVYKPVRRTTLFSALQSLTQVCRKAPVRLVSKDLDLGLNVLVAEDNSVNQLVISRLLTNVGCRVQLAKDGLEVVALAAANDYDVVFMDCQMPEMDGYQATAKIRELTGSRGQVRIIALTAGAMEGDRERCLDAGMDDFLTKPVRRESVVRILGPSTTAQAA